MRISSQLRVECDLRDNVNIVDYLLFNKFKVSPGWKFNHWELKGVPIRLELGPRDLAKEQVLAVIRYSGEKRPLEFENLTNSIEELLEQIHQNMYKRF